MIQVADMTGAYGVSFFVVLVNVLLFEIAYINRSAAQRILN